MDEKHAVAGDSHVEVKPDHAVSDLTSSGFAKTKEKDIRARNAEFAAAVSENRPNPWGTFAMLKTNEEAQSEGAGRPSDLGSTKRSNA